MRELKPEDIGLMTLDEVFDAMAWDVLKYIDLLCEFLDLNGLTNEASDYIRERAVAQLKEDEE